MKILNPIKPSMDNKLKFADRMKVLFKTEPRKDADPYVFSEPELIQTPISTATTGGKKLKLIAPSKNCKLPPSSANIKTKKKCLKQRDDTAKPPQNFLQLGATSKKHGLQQSSKQAHAYFQNLQKLKKKRRFRDHMLLYYPRAGDEISDSESSGDEVLTFQRHWYSIEENSSASRNARLLEFRSQLQRRLGQLHTNDKSAKVSLKDRAQCLIKAALKDPTFTASVLNDSANTGKVLDGPLIVGSLCKVTGCQHMSLPCTRHCSDHIMLNGEQLLFEHCTAKFSDNTQCSVPVFDVAHELPLCPEHARKRDNYHRRAQEQKPKKVRKKPVSPSVSKSKPKSRPKKRKRPLSVKLDKELPDTDVKAVTNHVVTTNVPNIINEESHQHQPINHHITHHFHNPIITNNENHTKTLNNLNVPQTSSSTLNSLGLELGSLGLKVDDHEVFPLDPNEHDFGNVLNNLPADAFNDLFIESRNGEYEPTREEEEELERALEAVNKDVRNLERMGQSHGLLEPALLAQIMSDIAS